MWRKRTIGNQTFVCYQDEHESIAIDETETDHILFQRYAAWLAEGNEPEEWTGE